MSSKSKKSNFTISERKLFLRIFDMLFIISGIIIASRIEHFYYFDFSSSKIFTWVITLGIYFVLFSQIFELYSLENSNDYFTILRSVIGTAVSITLLYVFTPLITPELPENRLQILYLFMAVSIPLVFWRILYIFFVFSPKYFKTVLVIGTGDEIRLLLNFIKEKASTNHVVACVSEQMFRIEGLESYAINNVDISTIVKEHSISEIVVADYHHYTYKKVHTQLVQLFEKGISIVGVKRFKEREASLMPELKVDDAFYDVITFSQNHHNRVYLAFMRGFDIFVALSGLLFMLAIIPFVVMINLFLNRGNLFYFQDRIGKNGRLFRIVKFRTMLMNAEDNGAVWAQKNDTRITKFGKFMRITRLDEVPQFFNILKGEMALIGPRPERPEFVEELEKILPFYAIRHIVKPGLTGWAQVMHPYASNMEDQSIKMRYDFYYIKERSLFLDFKILVRTITTVLFMRGQ